LLHNKWMLPNRFITQFLLHYLLTHRSFNHRHLQWSRNHCPRQIHSQSQPLLISIVTPCTLCIISSQSTLVLQDPKWNPSAPLSES
jgi:hypothetical protein